MLIAYTGLPGSGKTYLMSADLTRAIKQGRPVFANFPLRGAHYYAKLEHVMNVKKGIIACDELNTLAPATAWQSFPPYLLNLWSQSRKMGIDFWYTTQGFHRVNNNVRNITNFVEKCRKIIGPVHRADLVDAIDEERERSRPKIISSRTFILSKKVFQNYNSFYRIENHEMKNALEFPEDLPIIEDLEIMPDLTTVGIYDRDRDTSEARGDVKPARPEPSSRTRKKRGVADSTDNTNPGNV